ncbi:EamA family transporter [Solihabitans fulvus]|uniref:EamA family transporter n=1 Tax=Solihabitans fulvus TaxID=1892852 RepID=A0A5B2X3Q9_9PSEU|nr:DMT family transporter [Solihabitans fulvus]KAA2257917.1 EamA family transporter [Solihabitans fulvus]
MHISDTTLSGARPRSRAGLVCLALSGLLWGTGGLTGSLLGRAAGLPPLAVATYRLAVGGALIIAFLVVTGRRWPRGRAAWTRVAAVGGLAALYQASYFAAVSLTSVSLATLVTIGACPVAVVAAERLTGRRRVDRRTVGTVCLALAGLGLLVGLPTGGFSGWSVLGSACLAVLSAAGFAALTLLGGTAVPGLDELTTTGLGFAAGGLLLTPLAVVAGGLGFAPTATSIGLLVALGLVPTAVAYTLYFRGLRTVDASTAAVLALLEPLTGTLLAALLLGDRLGWPGLVGAALLAAAVLRSAR